MACGIALIGGGIFAKEAHLPAIRDCSDVELLAVYSRSKKSALELDAGQSVEIYSDDSGSGKGYDDLLRRDDVKGVIIALPILSQPDYIKRALKAGKHVVSEKPIAADVGLATELVQWYDTEIDGSKVMWSVAENYRFHEELVFASKHNASLGKLLQFHVRAHRYVKDDGKYFLTPWRKDPGYQGGFLLDGGIHHIAGFRLILGDDATNAIDKVSAFTAQLQPHLPPIDTINATLRTKGGVSGTVVLSFGTTLDDKHYHFGYEKGKIIVENGVTKVIEFGGNASAQESEKYTGTGVPEEIKAWASSMLSGRANDKQSPTEALADLKLLEAMIQSGEKDAAVVDLK